MKRIVPAVLAGWLLLFAGSGRAADGPAGAWRLTVPGTNLTFLIKLEEKDGKWSMQYLGSSIPNLAKPPVESVTVAPDSLRFNMKIEGRDFSFDGKLPPDKSGKIPGSILTRIFGNRMILASLEPSKLSAFDKYEFYKEIVDQSTDPSIVLEAALEVIGQAGEKKAKIEDVRGWADKAFKPAEGYGGRWQRHVALSLATAMASQKDLAPAAVEYARRAERLLDRDNDDASVQMEVLTSVAQVLTKAGKAEDAKKLDAELAKLEEKDYQEYVKKKPFKADVFDGRKGKSERGILVELFTGAECPPCVAADIGFEALEKTYKPTDVVLLQYHVHVPGPDPLTSPDSMSRMQYYGKFIEGTPTIFFNGKEGAGGGGQLPAGRKKYAEYREVIEPLLEKDADAKVQLTAARKDNEISIKANWSDAARTGDKVRLRFVLAEEHVRYPGGNGLRYHHFVVRSMPGGAMGFAVAKKAGEQAVTVNLEDVRLKLNDYLDDFAKNESPFPRSDRPLALKNLRVVAFVQDDANNEVLQAVQVEVK
jgi:hypothetical protein